MPKTLDAEASVALIQSDGQIYLMLSRDGDQLTIAGWSTPEEAKGYFERGYNNAHDRGYESSMSACINFIQFTPKIVTFPTLEALVEALGIVEGKSEAVRLSSISGWMDALILDQEKAKAVWESGDTPALISEDPA